MFNQISTVSSTVDALSAEERERILLQARSFNEQLAGEATELPADQIEPYAQQLIFDRDPMMSWVEIPSIDVSMPIYHGTSELVLMAGVGHLEGTSLPVGGESTHAVISAHRGLPSAKLFTHLDRLEVGDTFTITVLDRTLTYEVDNISIILPTETDSLKVSEGKDYITLMTCTPYGINTHRLLVRGHRVNTRESQKHVRVTADATRIAPIITAPVIPLPMLAVLLIWLLVTTRKRPKAGKHEKTTRGDPHETNS